MRNLFIAAIAAVVLTIASLSITLGQGYISDAAQALQSARVYVAPGTERTNSNTAGELQAQLRDDDNIVLIMLPSAAGEGTTIIALVSELSKALSDQRIIGLAVGREVVGYAPNLPTGVAADQMSRADSVSNDPVTALKRFARYIREWQAEQPLPPSVSEPSINGLTPLMMTLLVIMLVTLSVALYLTRSRKSTRFKAPEPVGGLLTRIYSYRDPVQEASFKETLARLCHDIVDYFEKSSQDPKKEAVFFKKKYLDDLIKLLDQYVELQNKPRVYKNREILLAQWREDIEDFDRFVHESTQRGAQEALREYARIAHTLSAYRDISFPER